MLFNSLTFVLFFLVVLAAHNLPLPWKLKKSNLLIASYLFYAAWNPPFVLLIWISTLVDWHAAKRMAHAKRVPVRRLFLLLSLICNLGLLGYFKYGGFVLDNFVALTRVLGIEFHPAHPDIILPVGISFYTFQTMSYSIDVYRGTAKPWKSFLDFALFVTFFPQLVAGPIVRAVDFLPQCVEPRKASARQLSWGLSLMTLGLFEKVAIADALLAPVADKVFSAATDAGFTDAWAGVLAFSGQIFCDFAGYSTCAIGVALCLGFHIQDNFRFPYAAIGFSDFWRRWHISLSSWLRDYLYVSLGGNRASELRTLANLMLTMLIGGLWHGASWTFVLWGGLHGTYLVAERLLKRCIAPSPFWNRFLVRLSLALATYGAVCLTWVFFRARDFDSARSLLVRMAGLSSSSGWNIVKANELFLVAIISLLMTGIHFAMRDTSIEAVANRVPWYFQSALVAAMLAAIVLTGGDDRAFIYFQF